MLGKLFVPTTKSEAVFCSAENGSCPKAQKKRMKLGPLSNENKLPTEEFWLPQTLVHVVLTSRNEQFVCVCALFAGG